MIGESMIAAGLATPEELGEWSGEDWCDGELKEMRGVREKMASLPDKVRFSCSTLP